jgi:1-phosphofructokinase
MADALGQRTRVVTLTPAPSIDRVYLVDGLAAGHVNRARHIEAHIGGNGVNLARDLRAAGNEVVAVVPLHMESILELVDDVSFFRVVAVPHPTRVNTVIIGGDGVTTNVNQAPNPLTELDWRSLHAATDQEVKRIHPDWLVIGGTIPAGDGTARLYPEKVAELARSTGARLCLDSPGPVVAEWLERGVAPHLISPNVSELEDALQLRIETMGQAVDAASRVVDSGVETVLVSLGERGALLVTADDVLWAHTPPTKVVNTTGAGDAALAGLMAQWNGENCSEALESALATAVRWGRAAVEQITPTIAPEHVAFTQVEIDPPRRALPL